MGASCTLSSKYCHCADQRDAETGMRAEGPPSALRSCIPEALVAELTPSAGLMAAATCMLTHECEWTGVGMIRSAPVCDQLYPCDPQW